MRDNKSFLPAGVEHQGENLVENDTGEFGGG